MSGGLPHCGTCTSHSRMPLAATEAASHPPGCTCGLASIGAGTSDCVAPEQVCFYGKTRQEVADKLAKALHDKQHGTFVKPHKLTLGDWLDTWLQEYKRPRIRAITFDSYEMLIRRHIKPAL